MFETLSKDMHHMEHYITILRGYKNHVEQLLDSDPRRLNEAVEMKKIGQDIVLMATKISLATDIIVKQLSK